MSIILGFCMFFLSFFPLWICVLFIDIKSILDKNSNLYTEYISVSALIILTLITLMILVHELEKRQNISHQEYFLISAKEEKTITTEYFLSNILPLYTFNFKVWDEVILFLIFFFMLAFLSIRHNNFTINILLELMNYRFYTCELKNEDEINISKIVMCKEILSARIGELIMVRAINNEYVVKL